MPTPFIEFQTKFQNFRQTIPPTNVHREWTIETVPLSMLEMHLPCFKNNTKNTKKSKSIDMKVEIFPIQKHHTERILFYPNLTVEEVPNYKLLLGHSHFDYVESLLNHTSSTAKLGEKRNRPVLCHGMPF